MVTWYSTCWMVSLEIIMQIPNFDNQANTVSALPAVKKYNEPIDKNTFAQVLGDNINNNSSMQSDVQGLTSQNSETVSKPSMRSLMERLSGKNYTELLAENDGDWDKYVRLASELLQGVVGARNDTRDWSKIMSSTDIVAAIREETGKMHGTTISVSSGQTAIIQNRDGVTLRQVSGTSENINEVLLNFGATHQSIPNNFANLVNKDTFDADLLNSLLNYTGQSTTSQNL